MMNYPDLRDSMLVTRISHTNIYWNRKRFVFFLYTFLMEFDLIKAFNFELIFLLTMGPRINSDFIPFSKHFRSRHAGHR